MKLKTYGKIGSLLLAVLIVASGILIPKAILEHQKDQLSASSGIVETENVAVYGSNEIGAKALELRIASLSEMVSDITTNDTASTLLEFTREPLDTELSQDAAISAATNFLTTLNTSFESQGLAFGTALGLSDYSNVQSTVAESDSAQSSAYDLAVVNRPEEDRFVKIDSTLYVSAEDTSLSLWLVNLGNCSLFLDAVSGIPVYIFADLGSLKAPLLGDKLTGLLLYSVAETYNQPFSDSVQFAFPEEITTPDTGKDSSGLECSTRYSNYVLTVKAFSDNYGYISALVLQLSV